MRRHSPRPWWIADSLCDDYVDIESNGGDLRMLQILKIIRGITLNIIIAAITVFGVVAGGDPTVVISLGLIGLMTLNGVELTDYLAAKRALEEAKEDE